MKVCCISTANEAQLAISYGVDALGFVSFMPSGPGIISEDQIEEIASLVPPSVSTFLLTSKQNAEEIISQQQKCKCDTIQLCNMVANSCYQELRRALPGVRIVQVIHVMNIGAVDVAVELAPYSDALLLDTGNPQLTPKILGGTGRVHDWEISKRIRESVDSPIFLAGGLTSENVRRAIDLVQPFAVDICSGVRTNGSLDEKKLAAFMDQIRM